MSQNSDPTPPSPKLTPTDARQGVVRGRVILVLGASLVLVVIGMLASFWLS